MPPGRQTGCGSQSESEAAASDRRFHIVPVGRHKGKVRTAFCEFLWEGKALNAQHPAWSPDSKFLAFSAEVDEWHDIGLFNIETQEITWMDQSAGDKTQPAWSRSGEIIGWVQAEGAKTSFGLRKEALNFVNKS